MAKPKGGLGKGLDALFVDNNNGSAQTPDKLSIGEIEPNREQPRKLFEAAALADLAESIRIHGVLQPVVVRPMPMGQYELVAGERRWRAARMAGLSEVPVVVRELTDNQAMEWALIENLQRENLNPMEEAMGFAQLMEQFGLTQEQVAERVGKSRPVVSNALRLLHLPEQVCDEIRKGKISAGHGRSLAGIEDEKMLLETAKDIMEKGLSVRQTEQIIRKLKQEKLQNHAEKIKAEKSHEREAWDNPLLAEAQRTLQEELARKVTLEGNLEHGRICIGFHGEDDLMSLFKDLRGLA